MPDKSNSALHRFRFVVVTVSMLMVLLLAPDLSMAVVTELNSAGGTNASNGLRFYIEDTTHIQVRRANNTGQVFSPDAVPPNTRLDNGVFLRANGVLYGPSHTVATFTPPMFSTYSISAVSPANPATAGVPQTATQNVGIASGPQVSIVWRYALPYDFITADVTLTIPAAYAVSAANPVRYYHVFDTYLGGSDQGCGVAFIDANGKRVAGTYKPSTAGSCPSSTAIPAGVSLVESFRERSGLNFSHYCTNGWSNFWAAATSSTACAIRRATSLNDTVTTTYIDTGIGIEYDFTAPGTYTFSYDFVIGSPTVPPYDHLEIQHDGSGSLCPENVTVLACSVSTVPCPPASYIVTGALTGAVSTTPATPVVTMTPATFNIGALSSTATVTLQGTAPGGTYTLVGSGLSSIPLNGTKCWNTTTNTASCTFKIANTATLCGFECMETGVAYTNLTSTPTGRNPLYTKPVNTDFKFDVVALQAAGVQSSAYTAASNVTVELFDDSASPQPVCNAYASPVASQAITFAAGDLGRKTLTSSFSLGTAYRKLRCRVKDTNVTAVYGCSSDVFAVRPQTFSSIHSVDANADDAGSSVSATPALKAGETFSLVADTGVVGYDEKPKVNTGLLEWPNVPSGGRTSPGTGALAGDLTFSARASASNGNGASGSFTYDEVGYFRFKTNGIYDDTFTSYSGDPAGGDCVVGSFSNTPDASGKYGCGFGNTVVSNHFGRFIPNDFAVNAPTFTPGCNAGGFSYMDQPFVLSATIEARNSEGGKTQNYSGNFARGLVSLQMENANSGTPIPNARLSGLGSPAWGSGSYPFVANQFLKLAAGQDGAYDDLDIGLGVADEAALAASARPYLVVRNMDASNTACTTDLTGLSTAPAVCTATKIVDSTKMRHGRAVLRNAYGSELLDLPVGFRAEYWNGSGWVLNTADTCTGNTVLSAANAVSVALVSAPAGLTCVQDSGNPGLSGAGCAVAAPAVTRRFKEGAAVSVGFVGDFNLWLRAPGANNFGKATIAVTVPAWLGVVPPAVATFGRYKTPLIFRRENY